jgi:23S rRNA pseudouridine1911/1915/1917 synthase
MAAMKKKTGIIPTGAPGHPVGAGRKAAVSGRGIWKAEKESRGAAGSGGPRSRRDEDEDKALPRRRRPTTRGGEVRYLHEDDDIIVVDKPAGLPVIAAEGSRSKTLYDIVTERIRARNPKGRAAVVHRIDRDTSGVLVFAKNARAKKILMEGWDEMARKRLYVALVEGCPREAAGKLETWLIADGSNRVRIADAGERGAKLATTKFKVLGRGAGLGLLELELETGRKHQIRAQLADSGWPVSGDPKYGAKGDAAGRLGLHASLLVLVHPTSGEILSFESPAPPAFAAALREGPAARGSAPRPVNGVIREKSPPAEGAPGGAKPKPRSHVSSGERGRERQPFPARKGAKPAAEWGETVRPGRGGPADRRNAKPGSLGGGSKASAAKSGAAKSGASKTGTRPGAKPAAGGKERKGPAPAAKAPRSAPEGKAGRRGAYGGKRD